MHGCIFFNRSLHHSLNAQIIEYTDRTTSSAAWTRRGICSSADSRNPGAGVYSSKTVVKYTTLLFKEKVNN